MKIYIKLSIILLYLIKHNLFNCNKTLQIVFSFKGINKNFFNSLLFLPFSFRFNKICAFFSDSFYFNFFNYLNYGIFYCLNFYFKFDLNYLISKYDVFLVDEYVYNFFRLNFDKIRSKGKYIKIVNLLDYSKIYNLLFIYSNLLQLCFVRLNNFYNNYLVVVFGKININYFSLFNNVVSILFFVLNYMKKFSFSLSVLRCINITNSHGLNYCLYKI